MIDEDIENNIFIVKDTPEAKNGGTRDLNMQNNFGRRVNEELEDQIMVF